MKINCGTITSINSFLFLSSFASTLLTYQSVIGQTRLHTFIGTIVTVWTLEWLWLYRPIYAATSAFILPLNLCSRIISITILNYLWYIYSLLFQINRYSKMAQVVSGASSSKLKNLSRWATTREVMIGALETQDLNSFGESKAQQPLCWFTTFNIAILKHDSSNFAMNIDWNNRWDNLSVDNASYPSYTVFES